MTAALRFELSPEQLAELARLVVDEQERRKQRDREPMAAVEPRPEDYERMRALLRRKGIAVIE